VTSGAIPDPASVLEALFRRRLIVVTGKGGTGKTSLGAALARLAAAAGKRVLACEVGRAVDSPSPLLGLLAPERTAKNEPQALDGTLSHVVLRGDDGVRQFLGDVMPFQFMANRALKVEAVRRFLDAAPAFGEMGVLYRGQKYLEERRRDGSPVHELMILDAPASGHTLAFASLPDTILKVFTAGPIATAARAGIELIRDPVSTTVVAATLPEPLPVSELTELCAGLRERGLDVGAVVANQVPHDPFSAEERAALDARLPLEVLGRNALARMTKAGDAFRRLATLGAPVLRVESTSSSGPALVTEIMRSLAPGAA